MLHEKRTAGIHNEKSKIVKYTKIFLIFCEFFMNSSPLIIQKNEGQKPQNCYN